MNRFRLKVGLTMLAIAAIAAQTSWAAFHLWRFTEFYSNTDGSVQFVELHSSSNNENVANGAEIRSVSTGKVFAFPGNLSSTQTANKRLLIATPGFGSLPGGVAPDYDTLPANFFDPAGDTIQLFSPLFGVFHTRTFASAPTDGMDSLNYDPPTLALAIRANSPTNFAGAVGSVNLAPMPTGDYNNDGVVDAADYTVWRNTLGNDAVPDGSGADGNANGEIDEGDYLFWKERYGDVIPPGSGGISVVPEPASIAIAVASLLPLCMRRR